MALRERNLQDDRLSLQVDLDLIAVGAS